MDNDAYDYLSNLPDELKIKILSNLNTADLIQVCEASPLFERLSFEKRVISTINFEKEYRLEIGQAFKFVSNQLRFYLITCLNVNCVYWIPALEIRKCLGKLVNLDSLYAIDTKLSLCANDCICYSSMPKLRALAITTSDEIIDFINMKHFPSSLTHFYVQLDFIKHNSMGKLGYIFMHLKRLDELWVVDLSTPQYHSGFVQYLTSLETSLKKLVIIFRTAQDLAMVRNFSGSKFFQNTRRGCQMIYETTHLPTQNIYEVWEYSDCDWNTLINKLKFELPFNIEDSKKLVLKQCPLESISFEELNFNHTPSLCCKLLRDTLRNILTGKNMKLLKKLSVNFCISEQDVNKLIKTNEGPQPRESTLEALVKNSPLIEELEIWGCTFNGLKLECIENNAFHCISTLKYLKKLTLDDVPIHLSCSFLSAIFKTCTELTSLRVHSRKQNSALNNFMCLALSDSPSSLKDLRFEHAYIPINRLMESLNDAKDLKLVRLFIKCQRIEEFKSAPFKKFITNNPQMRFLCIVIENLPKTAIRTISNAANQFKDNSKMIIRITTDANVSGGRILVPYIHRMEMINCDTMISIINPFNGFVRH